MAVEGNNNATGTTQADGQSGNPAAQAAANTDAGATNPQTGGTNTTVETGATTEANNAGGLSETERLIEKLRKEAAGYRTQLREYQTREQTAKDAELSELDKLKKQLGELTTANEQSERLARQLKIERAVEREAARLRFNDPADALSMIQANIELDEKGDPINVKSLLDALVKAKPYLTGGAQTQTPPPNVGSPANPARNNVEALTSEKLAKLTPDQIVKLMGTPEMQAYLSSPNSR